MYLIIIAVLILAGVTLNILLGENGILNKAELESKEYENKAVEEENTLAQAEHYIANYRDTVTIPKEKYDKLKNANTYSEEEIKIGT